MDWNTYITDLNIPNNWKNTSYHNDELPSYQVNGLHIWIDSHNVSERELNTKNIIGSDSGLMPRFTVQTASSYNCYDDDHTWIFETDSFQELLEFVNSKKQWAILKDGIWITDPYYDETGRFFVDPIEYYGLTKKDLNEYGSIN
jgi:hypothetical protein|tara:strand:- start:7 stop:438 length:432 start_codon:yes stop_codon:yes gene_type:complete